MHTVTFVRSVTRARVYVRCGRRVVGFAVERLERVKASGARTERISEYWPAGPISTR